MNKRGLSSLTTILVALAVIVVGGATWYFSLKNAVPQQKEDQISTIRNFVAQWDSLQKLIPSKPVLGSTFWTITDIQFIGKNKLLIAFEDGHVVFGAVFGYTTDNQFEYVEEFRDDFPFTCDKWKSVIKEYGDEKYPIAAYTKGVVRDAKIINFSDWTKVSETTEWNPFVGYTNWKAGCNVGVLSGQFISPAGGEQWRLGQTHNIQWQPVGIQPSVLNLYDEQGNIVGQIYTGESPYQKISGGSYVWDTKTLSFRATTVILKSGNYKIELVFYPNPEDTFSAVKVLSNVFSISR